MYIQKRKLKSVVIVSGLTATLVVFGVFIWLIRDNNCYRQCDAAVILSERHAENGKYYEAIMTLDKTDASCHCAQFTDGDEPPEYSAMRAYLNQYRKHESKEAIKKITDSAHGPILRQLVEKIER